MLEVLERWDDATVHVKECQAFFEDLATEKAIVALGSTPEGQSSFITVGYHQGLIGMGHYQRRQDDYTGAARWFHRASQFALTNFGKTHQYAEALDALAETYALIRDYQREEPRRLEALDVYQKFQGEGGKDSINALVALAWNYNKQGRHAQAEPMMRRAIELAPKNPLYSMFGGELWLATMKNGLADILQRIGKVSEATKLFAETSEVMRKGDLPLMTAQSKEMGIAVHHFNSGNNLFYYAKQYKEAEDHLLMAVSVLEKQASPEIQDYTDRARRALASAQWFQGKRISAQENARKWMRGYDARLNFILRFTSEDQRMSWMNWQSPFDLAAAFGMADDLAHLLLRTKGIVLDSIMEDRVLAQKAATSEGSGWETLVKTRDDLRQAWAAAKPDLAIIAKLEAQETALQSSMASAGAAAATLRNTLKISVKDVQQKLPPNSVLIDYFRYYGWDETGKSIERYAAIVHHHDAPPDLRIMPWTAAQLDDAMHVFRNAMRNPGRTPHAKDADLEILMKTLHSGFISGLEGTLKNVKTLFIAGDSELNFLPFATLMNAEGKFLCERFEIRQVNSARDLAAPAPEEKRRVKTLAMYGDASYRLERTAALESSAGGTRAFTEQMLREGRTILPPLPGTKRELLAISQRAKDAGWTIQDMEGQEATEASLRSVQSPGVLHLATHGYFMERSLPQSVENVVNLTKVDGRPQRFRSLFDPMSRSGVFLAGAENSFEQWRKGSIFSLDNDGVLTAAEAGSLDLRDTWLVVLSACDTGAGDSISGEGVLGLRRGFFYAGARNVMMSLWPIFDEATADFINEFYARAFASGDAAAALHETEKSWLVRLKKEKGLWHAIKCGGAFILVGTGR